MVAPQTVNLSSFDFGSSSLPTSTKKILKKVSKIFGSYKNYTYLCNEIKNSRVALVGRKVWTVNPVNVSSIAGSNPAP